MDDLQRLLIERACGRLVTRYCHLIDHGQAAQVAGLFCDDGVWATAERTLEGRDAIAAAFGRREADAARMSRHICENLLIEVLDERAAQGVVYLTLHRHDGEPGRATSPLQLPFLLGEYRDSFVLTDDGWRVRRREVVADFVRS